MKMKKLLLICLVVGSSFTLRSADFYGGGAPTVFYTVNVKAPSYGAKGDARKVTDAVLNGTTTVTSATAAFVAADAGKVIWGIETASGAARLAKTTISSVTNSTTIIVAVAATGSYTGISLVWGTDDTVAIQAAAAAANASSPKGQVFIPSGGYVFNDRLFNQSYSSSTDTYPIIGAGCSSTFLFPTPDHARTGSRIFETQSNATRGYYYGFTIDGSFCSYANPRVTDTPASSYWNNVSIINFRGLDCMLSVGTSDSVFEKCRFEQAQGGAANGMSVNGGATFIECYSGNHANHAVVMAGGTVRWIGGTIDETGSPSAYIQGGKIIIENAQVFAGGSTSAIELRNDVATSSARIIGSDIGPFGGNNNCTALKVTASTSTVAISNSTLTHSGTGKGLNNSGIVYDGGSNIIDSFSGTGMITGTAGSSTIANLPAAPVQGMYATITDGDAGLAWGATAVNSGAGATKYLVWYNGSAWTVVAK